MNYKKLFSTYALKLIAVISMFVDHFSRIIIEDRTPLLFQIVGRLAFPIFAFLISEGFKKTRSMKSYLLRVGIAAIISEIPYDLAFFKTPVDMERQNVMFTLGAGLIALYLWGNIIGCERGRNPILAFKAASYNQQIFAFGIIVMMSLLCFVGHTDYGLCGVLIIFIFYFMRDLPLMMFITAGAALVLFLGVSEIPAILSFIPIYFYNGKLGSEKVDITEEDMTKRNKKQQVIQILYYVFYPAHLILLIILRFVLA